MAIMPEITKKFSIIGRSPTGVAILAFETEDMARRWIEKSPNHRIKFFKQQISEEEIQIDLRA